MALDSQAVAAARALARQVVSAGLAETEPVRQAYFAYVEAGCPGMFGDALVERGLVSFEDLAELPDDGTDHQSAAETGRFPRPSDSGRFPAAAKKKRASARLVPQSGLDLLADVDDEAEAAPAAKPALDPRIPAGWGEIKADEKGLSILTELEGEDADRPPVDPSRQGTTAAGVAKLKGGPRPQPAAPPMPALPPLPAAGALPAVQAALPVPEGLSLDLGVAESVLEAPGPAGPSFDDLALDLEAVKAKATRQVARPARPAPESEPEELEELDPAAALEAIEAQGSGLERSMDELSFGGNPMAAVEAAVASGRSLDELGFDLSALGGGQAPGPAAASPASMQSLEEAVASGRSLDELGFDAAALGAASPWGAPAAAAASPWGAGQASADATAGPWGGAQAAPPGAASPWGAAQAAPGAAASPWGAPAAAQPASSADPPQVVPPARSDDDDPLANLEVSGDEEANFFAPVDAEEAPAASPARDEDDDDLRVGDQLGDYELVSELGRGGMGIVFKALRKGSVHHYAIKVLKPGTGPVAQKRRRRFQREVEIMRQLDHNNLIRIYDCGRHGLYDWYSMDFVEGTELAQMLAEYRLSPDEKLQVFEEICKAMAHAHERAVVHRDLKPANILVGPELTVRVLDFGLAKIERENEDHNLTQAGTALGTPYYMSPEQILNPTDVGPEADVWSMGVMLYEMMTGRRPFVGQTAGEIANAILNHDPAPPSKINQFLHADIEAICMRALDKDLGTRYATVEGMLADMQRHRRGKKVERKSSRGLRRWLSQNKGPFLTGVGVASVVWGAVVAYLQLT